MAFTQKTIKENIKPTIWQYLVQYKRMICSIMLIIIIVMVYINYSNNIINHSVERLDILQQQLPIIKLSIHDTNLTRPHLKPQIIYRS